MVNKMGRKDNERINAFLGEFVKALAKKYGGHIDFVLLFGSAARGEFKAGTSDVDLIIQVNNPKYISSVEKYAEDIFWKLDKKHGTMLHEVCSTKGKDFLSFFEKNVKLYKPFEILGPEDIDWHAGVIRKPELVAWSMVAPITQFVRKIKTEGKVLYGRDIINEINAPYSAVDKAKALFIPLVLSLLAILTSFFLPNKSISYASKAILYSIDDQLFFLEQDPKKRKTLSLKLIRSETGSLYSTRLAKEAFEVKGNSEKIKSEWSYADKVSFSFQSLFYILWNDICTIIRLFQRIFNIF